MGVHAVACGWLESERARSSANARKALRTYLPIDPSAQSDYLHQLWQVLTDEMIPRTRGRLRALEAQFSQPATRDLKITWRQTIEDLNTFSDHANQSVTIADADHMRGLMARVDELERDATTAVTNARRLAGLNDNFEEVLLPALERLRQTQVTPGTSGLFDIAELGLGRRVATLTGRVRALRTTMSGPERPVSQEEVDRLLERADSLLESITELEDEIAAMSVVEAEWQRCLHGEMSLIESGMVAGTTPEQALKAMQRLYVLRRHDQPAVLLGDTVLFPSPLNERNWDALSGELLAPDRSCETGPDDGTPDYESRIGLLLNAWGYVAPPMLWYECGSEEAARERMRDYVVRGGGKGRTLMQGKTVKLNTRKQRGKTSGASRGKASQDRKDAAKKTDPQPVDRRNVAQDRVAASPQSQYVVDNKGRQLRVGDEINHALLGRCTLVRIVDKDRIWLRVPGGSTKSVILSQTPLR